MISIALDNGHGLNTSGKRSPIFTDGALSPYTGLNFMHEWEFNRRTVQLLKPMLERCGFRVFEISPTEEDTSIDARWKKANDLGVNYFLSIHANAMTGEWGSARGIETLVHNGSSDETYRIGRVIQKHMVAATGLFDRCASMPNQLYEREDIGVLHWTHMPAALVECGFMDNPTEIKLLLSEDYRKLCAEAICKALCEAFNISFVPEPIQKEEVKKMGEVFKDVPAGHWCENDLKMLKAAGLMEGYADGTFKGDKAVTRYELAAAIAVLYRKGVK